MEFTHFDSRGNAVMVEVGDKKETRREAEACGRIFMSQQCFCLLILSDLPAFCGRISPVYPW